MTSGEVNLYRYSRHTHNYTFLKGHRIMTQVQSSWFPIIDRNPQMFVANIFEAKAEDFVKATHTIHLRSKAPSRVAVSVEKPVR